MANKIAKKKAGKKVERKALGAAIKKKVGKKVTSKPLGTVEERKRAFDELLKRNLKKKIPKRTKKKMSRKR